VPGPVAGAEPDRPSTTPPIGPLPPKMVERKPDGPGAVPSARSAREPARTADAPARTACGAAVQAGRHHAGRRAGPRRQATPVGAVVRTRPTPRTASALVAAAPPALLETWRPVRPPTRPAGRTRTMAAWPAPAAPAPTRGGPPHAGTSRLEPSRSAPSLPPSCLPCLVGHPDRTSNSCSIERQYELYTHVL